MTNNDELLRQCIASGQVSAAQVESHRLAGELADTPRLGNLTDKEYFVVWNADKTEGFITEDRQLAYEVRKSSETNCFDRSGRRSDVGIAFCDAWGDQDCTMEPITFGSKVPRVGQQVARSIEAAHGITKVAQHADYKKSDALIFADDRPTSCDDTLYQWAVDAENLIRHQESVINMLTAKIAKQEKNN